MHESTWAQPALEATGEERQAQAAAEKKCTKCGETKSVHGFEMVDRAETKTAPRRRGVCRDCMNAKRRLARHGPKPGRQGPQNPVVDGQKRCNKCEDTKPVSEFHFGKGYKGYSAGCKTCMAEVSRKRRRARMGLPLDTPPMRERDPLPEGTVRVGRGGYLEVKVTGHHRARKNWVFEHIVVAERVYGFPITRAFSVHHRNGDKADNRPENVELRYGQHGRGADVLPALLRLPEMRAVARQILAQYDDLSVA